jgi:predicted transcriptional regulator
MKRGKKLTSQISIRLEDEVKSALEEIAAADDRSLSSLINRVLRQFVESNRAKKPKAKG